MSASRKPICGICMGNQLLAKAGGATIYKLKYGHRSHNQPVREIGTNRCYVTSQNHGYAVDASTLGDDWRELFVNMNDGSNEGIRHLSNPWFSSQFHPEACSGPVDTEFNDVAGGTFKTKGLSAKYVAKVAVDGMFKGKMTIVPGFKYKAGLFFQRLIPRRLSLMIISKFQQKKMLVGKLL